MCHNLSHFPKWNHLLESSRVNLQKTCAHDQGENLIAKKLVNHKLQLKEQQIKLSKITFIRVGNPNILSSDK